MDALGWPLTVRPIQSRIFPKTRKQFLPLLKERAGVRSGNNPFLIHFVHRPHGTGVGTRCTVKKRLLVSSVETVPRSTGEPVPGLRRAGIIAPHRPAQRVL